MPSIRLIITTAQLITILITSRTTSSSNKITNLRRKAQEDSLSEIWSNLSSIQPVSQPQVDEPTSGPIIEGTAQPVQPAQVVNPLPSSRPTSQPSFSPITIPSSSPSNSPTSSPTSIPTKIPTLQPSSIPTTSPTPNPTSDPTSQPSTGPTRSPSNKPTFLPSSVPTNTPSLTPTKSPTGPPLSSLITETVTGLSIQLQPLTPLDSDGTLAFEEGTDLYYSYYYNNPRFTTDSLVQAQVRDVTVETKVTSQTPENEGGRRLQLQTIIYDQTISYRTLAEDATVSIQDIVEDALDSKAKRDVYMVTLKDTSTVFDPVQTVYMVEYPSPNQQPPPSSESQQPPPTEPVEPASGGMGSTTIAIICVVVGLVLLFAVLGGVWFMNKRKNANNPVVMNNSQDLEEDMSDGVVDVDPRLAARRKQALNSEVQIRNNYQGTPDEVSTLAEPMPKLGVMSSSGESYIGPGGAGPYEDKSIATMDYDYSKAYGGNNSFRQQQQQQQPDLSPQQQQAAQPSTFSVFSDDASFDAHYQEPYKEAILEVLAPAGKLGVVIDTPDEGAPIVHAIKDSSCVAEKLRVGDKLIRVDDEDVTAMTAIKVSKLISRKSANPVRKLTIVRSVVADD